MIFNVKRTSDYSDKTTPLELNTLEELIEWMGTIDKEIIMNVDDVIYNEEGKVKVICNPQKIEIYDDWRE